MKKGMTLIEIIIAMAILSIFSLAILSVFSYAVVGIYHFGDDTVSVFDSQENMEAKVAVKPRVQTGASIIFDVHIDGNDYQLNVDGENFSDGELDMFLPEME